MYSCEREHGIGYTCTEQPSLHVMSNGRDFAYAQGGSVVVRNYHDPHEQLYLQGHLAPVTCVALSPNGSFLASGDCGKNSDVVVWDVVTQQELWRFTEHDSGIKTVDFSHDERLLLIVGCDNRLSIFDMKTGMLVAATDLPKSIGKVNCATWGGFKKDLKRRNTETYQFATAGSTVAMWTIDPYRGVLAVSIAESRRNVRQCVCVTFTHVPDSAGREGYFDEFILLGTLSGDFVSYIVKPNKADPSGVPVASFASSNGSFRGGVSSIVTSPVDEKCIGVGGGDGTVAIFRFREADGAWIDTEGTMLNGPVCGLAFSPDGTEIVAGSKGGALVRGKCGMLAKATVLIGANPCAGLTGISFAPESSDTFATCSLDGCIRVWSTEDYTVLMETSVRGAQPTCLQYSIDAILSGWTDGCVRSHHASTGELLWTIKDAHIGGVSALRLSHNMRYVITGGEEGEVRVWELRMRQLVSHLKEHTGRVTNIVIFEDDVHAISCSRDRSILCWDLRQDKRISAHTQRMGGLSDIALNHDQTVVISMGQERTISFWDLRESYPIYSIQSVERDGMHHDEATSICVSHSGNLFATGGADHVVKLWCIDQDKPILLQNNTGHTGKITGMSFTADDKQLVSIGEDGAIFIWNIFPEEAQEAKTKK